MYNPLKKNKSVAMSSRDSLINQLFMILLSITEVVQC